MSFKVVIYLGLLLPTASSVQPGAGGPRTHLLELASDGVYMATAVTSGTVVSYTAFPPLLNYLYERSLEKLHFSRYGLSPSTAAIIHRYSSKLESVHYYSHTPLIAERYISVALSLELPPPAVSRHPCPVKPGLSSPQPLQKGSDYSSDLIDLLNVSYRIHEPPINSRTNELLGITSGAIGRK